MSTQAIYALTSLATYLPVTHMCCSAFACTTLGEQMSADLNWIGGRGGRRKDQCVASRTFLINDSFIRSPNLYSELLAGDYSQICMKMSLPGYDSVSVLILGIELICICIYFFNHT